MHVHFKASKTELVEKENFPRFEHKNEKYILKKSTIRSLSEWKTRISKRGKIVCKLKHSCNHEMRTTEEKRDG